jgi:hypothetical protein
MPKKKTHSNLPAHDKKMSNIFKLIRIKIWLSLNCYFFTPLTSGSFTKTQIIDE